MCALQAARFIPAHPAAETATLSVVPQGRWCEPEEVAEAVISLLESCRTEGRSPFVYTPRRFAELLYSPIGQYERFYENNTSTICRRLALAPEFTFSVHQGDT